MTVCPSFFSLPLWISCRIRWHAGYLSALYCTTLADFSHGTDMTSYLWLPFNSTCSARAGRCRSLFESAACGWDMCYHVLSIYLRPKRRVLKVSKMERPCKIYSNRSKSYLAAVFAYRSSKAPLKSSKIQRICRWHLGSQVIPFFVSRIVAQNKYII